MKSNRSLIAFIVLLFIPVFLAAQSVKSDLEMAYKMKHEERKNSKIDDLSFWMTDFVGPRLTASQGKLKANEWAKNKMIEMGLKNVRIEEVKKFERGGWDNYKTYVAMTAPYYANFAATPVAWSGSTNGEIKGKVVYLDIKEEKDLEKYKGKLKKKIVLVSATDDYEPKFEAMASRMTDEELKKAQEETIGNSRRWGNFNIADYIKKRRLRAKIANFIKDERAAVILNSAGEFNVSKSTGLRYKSEDPEPTAVVNLPIEAHGRIQRLIKHNVDVHMEVNIKNKFSKSPQVTNVIGEIPGTDPKLKDEIVLIGAHWDCWHGGTGAADNASGCIVMMEAMRILKSLKIEPRRTIRIALWGGEEQGLYGSKGYVEQYLRDPKTYELKEGYEKFAAYFNMDNGTGKFRGIYLQRNEMVRPIFEEWMKPFHSMGMNTISINNTGGTDHQSFDALGLPAFQFIQDDIEYNRGYHTNMDTYERLIMNDLKNNAVIIANFVYQAAKRDEKLPRKPYEAPTPWSRAR